MGRPPGACRVALVGLLALVARPAAGQDGILSGLQKSLETTFSSVSTTTTLASGDVMKTDTTNVFPSLNLNLSTLLYPGLRLTGGGVFEVNMASVRTDGVATKSTIGRNRPFLLLRSTDPVFSPGFGYFRREDRSRVAGLSSVKLVNDEYAAYLGWYPAGGPRSDFQFLRSHTYDSERSLQDLDRSFVTLISNYTYRNLAAYYNGSYLGTNDRLRRTDTRQLTQGGRVSYSGSFLAKRLTLNGTYNITHQDLRTVTSGEGGQVDVPVTPYAGLSTLNDLPTTATLLPNPSLIDGTLTAGAGVDLGLPAAGSDQQARNIGLDFLNPAEVNRLLIWVDRDLPVEVTNSFGWDIYSSPDNIIWTRETTVAMATFGPFENRFEVDFPAVTSRYLKVVTRPLSAAVPDSSRFPNILVTELQAFLRQPAGAVRSQLTRTTHLINSDVRMRILDAPLVFYEGLYLYNGPDAFGRHTDTVSNGLSANHTFGRIFSAYGRAAYEQGRQPQGYRTATVTNATLTVEPFPTLRSSVLYTGQDERIAGVPNTRQGLYVQNNARPYRGIDVVFGLGWNATERETGEVLHDRLVNASATVVPREHMSLTFSYDGRRTTRSGAFTGNPLLTSRRLYAAVAVDPIQTFHLVLGEEVIAATDQRTRTTLDIGANWAPFPDGALQFIFASNAALRELEFGNERSTVGAVRWNVSRRSYVNVSYQKTRSEFLFQTTATRLFSVTMRMFF